MAPSGTVSPSPGPLELPPSTKVPLERANPLLSCTIGKWLKVHGKTVKPKLSESQKADARMCFKLMDADGSGAIDAEELGAAFRLLGISMSQREVEAMLAEVDRDGSGEVEYAEFLEIMTLQLTRKKLMEALEEDDKDFILSVAAAEEEEKRRSEAATAAAASRRSSRRLSAAVLQSLGRSPPTAGAGAAAASRAGRANGVAASPGPSSHASFLDSLTKEERRIIDVLSRKYRAEAEAEQGAALPGQHQQQLQHQGSNNSTARSLAGKATAGAVGPTSHLAALQQTASSAAARLPDLNLQYRLHKTGPAMVAAGVRRSPSPPRSHMLGTRAAAGAAAEGLADVAGRTQGLRLPGPLFSKAGF